MARPDEYADRDGGYIIRSLDFDNYRDKAIVDPHREAYAYPVGNVRGIFDSRIRTSNSILSFLSQNLATIPAANAIILEVKYDGFLPHVMFDILKIGRRNQGEFSKFVVARLV